MLAQPRLGHVHFIAGRVGIIGHLHLRSDSAIQHWACISRHRELRKQQGDDGDEADYFAMSMFHAG